MNYYESQLANNQPRQKKAESFSDYVALHSAQIALCKKRKDYYEARLAVFEQYPAWRRWLAGGRITRWYYREQIMVAEGEIWEAEANWI